MAPKTPRELLLKIRKDCDLSQEAVCEELRSMGAMDVSRATICMWETGGLAVGPRGRRQLRKYAVALGKIYKKATGLLPPEPHEMCPDLAPHRRKQ